MKGTSVIFAAVAIIAITADFRAEGVPTPQESDEDVSFTMVDGFAFEGKADRPVPSSSTDQPRTVAPTRAPTRPPTRAPTRAPTRVPIGAPTPAPTPVPTPVPTTVAPSVVQCSQNCRVTSEYNPVCGTDSAVYTNPGLLNCARNCGMNVRQAYVGPCVTSIRG